MSKNYAESKYNAAFDRCIDVMARMLQKYGPSLIDKGILEESLSREDAKIQSSGQVEGQRHSTAA